MDAGQAGPFLFSGGATPGLKRTLGGAATTAWSSNWEDLHEKLWRSPF